MVAELPTAEARLAEYAALREEIGRRNSFQHGLVAFSVTIAGVVLGLALRAGDPQHELLSILAITNPVLGLIWLDHHVVIQAIGRYTRDELCTWEPSWEKWRAKNARQPKGWLAVYVACVTTAFVALPTSALAVSLSAVRSIGGLVWVLWAVGLIATFAQTVMTILASRFEPPND